MAKRVLDVGNCVPDHAAIRRLLETTFSAEVVQAHRGDDALEQLRRGSFDLVLVNRKLDEDYSDGLEIIKQIKAEERLAHIPCMLITNYPDHQETAVSAGAVWGFGKKELSNHQTRQRLAKFLAPEA
jgi:CheY-like chemotaxis protein